MMREFRLLGLFVVIAVGACFSQSINDTSSQGGTSSSVGVDCSDPFQASSPECMTLQGKTPAGSRTSGSSPSIESVPQLRAPVDVNQSQFPPGTNPPNPSETTRLKGQAFTQTEFEQMVADSAGRPLPLFGQSLFEQPPSTFAPLDLLQVPSDYLIGPGDELQIRIWGQLEANLHVTVDRSGQIFIPRVGQV